VVRWRSAAAHDTLQALLPGSLVTPIDPRLTLVTRDPVFERYAVERILA
jgi:hypothetical protein